jgi:hypothetical protein
MDGVCSTVMVCWVVGVLCVFWRVLHLLLLRFFHHGCCYICFENVGQYELLLHIMYPYLLFSVVVVV